MTDNPITASRPELTAESDGVSARADVLVIGGGPSGCWAAITAAEHGASVVLVDKGYCGTSGATASAGTGVWYIEPDAEEREAAIQTASHEEYAVMVDTFRPLWLGPHIAKESEPPYHLNWSQGRSVRA